MQLDFHYYATYCAAFLAGYSHEESLAVAYSSQFTDCCSKTYLTALGAPAAAATTQLQLEMMDIGSDLLSLQEITRIWSPFHFLPCNLYADLPGYSRSYLYKYRLICDVNSELLEKAVNLAAGGSLQAAGIAMHVLADTWAHRYFAGTPSLVINNTDFQFTEILPEGDGTVERRVNFNHNPGTKDDLAEGHYTSSVFQARENSIMNLGHGRAGHLPDYSFMRYRYLPAWNRYREIEKDNPSDYRHAFCQMIYALKCLRGEGGSFCREVYDFDAISEYESEIHSILTKRQLDACADWKAFCKKLSGREIEDFSEDRHREEYLSADAGSRDSTFLGQYILAALAHKSMVTHEIFASGNLLAGFSADYTQEGFKGIKDFIKLVEARKGEKDE